MLTISEHASPRGRSFPWLIFAVLAVMALMAGLMQVPTAHAQEDAQDSAAIAGLDETDETDTIGETTGTEEISGTDSEVDATLPEVAAEAETEEGVAATLDVLSAEPREKGDLFITDAQLTRSSAKKPSDPLLAGERLTFSFNWDASQYYATPNAAREGDTITVTLPAWAQFANGTAEMKDSKKMSIGTCVQSARTPATGPVTTPSKVVCTLNANVNGLSEVSGGFESMIEMVKGEQITPSSFQVGPADVVIDMSKLVDQPVIDQGVVTGPPAETKFTRFDENAKQGKTGSFHGLLTYTQGKAIIEWQIFVKGNGGSVTVRDELPYPAEMAAYAENVGARQGATDIRVRDAVAEGEAGGSWYLTTDTPVGTATYLARDQFSVDWTKEDIDGQNRSVVTVGIPNAEEGKWYRVSIFTQVDPDYYRAGDIIQNTASIDGQTVTAKATARNTINAYGKGVQGLGDVFIFKNVGGVDPAAIPAEYSARVKALITYPDNRTETKILEIKPGSDPATAGQLLGLPYLTKVTLTEEDPGTIPGFKLDTHTFGEGRSGSNVPRDDVQITPDKSSVTLTVRNADVTEIGLNNAFVPAIKYGTFNIKKTVTKPEPQPAYGKRYVLTYTCDQDSKDGSYKANTLVEKELADNETFNAGEFPVGTTCVVDEKDSNIPGFTWTKSEAQTVTIVEGTGATANLGTITNSYNEQLGSLKIVKRVNIEPAEAADQNQFKFSATCVRANPAYNQTFNAVIGANGEAVFNDIPAGATCTVTEDSESARIPGYTWQPEAEKVEVIIADKAQAEAVVTNTYTKDVGKLVVTKTVKASATAGVTGKTFDFTYRCENKDLNEIKEGEILGVTAGETKTVEGIAAGSKCEVTEKAAEVPLATLQVEGGATKTVDIEKDKDGLTQFENVYTEFMGQVKLNKKLAGSAAELDKLKDQKFEANYTCVKNGAEFGGTVTFSVNEPAVIKDVPLGSVCTFTEKTGGLTEIEGVVFDAAKSTLEAKDVALPTAEADKDKVTEVELVNHFDELGRINLKKVVTGLAASMVKDGQFPVTASWQLEGQDPQTVSFILREGEVYDKLPALPVGTVVTFKETLPANSALTSWKDPEYSGEGTQDLDDATAEVTIQPGTFEAVVEVELNNKVNPPLWWIPLLLIPFIPTPEVPTYQAPVDPATSTPSPTPAKGIAKGDPQQPAQENKGFLANTGASVLWILFAGVLAVMIGAVLFIRSRRNS